MTLALLGVICITVMAVFKVIDGVTAVDTVKWIILGVAGALAVSDVGNGIANRGKADATEPPEPPKENVPAK